MFIIFLRFSIHQAAAHKHLEAHKQWLKRGFADGVFLLAGSLEPRQGGGILAHGCTLQELHQRLSEDPFVSEQVVAAEVSELDPGMAAPALQFLVS